MVKRLLSPESRNMIEPRSSRFWQSALRSGLIDAEKLQSCWDLIPEAKRTEDAIDRRLARQTVESGHLTLWQAQQLMSGRVAGFQIDKYILLSLIGQGGMGRVYLARDTRLNRRVAIKVLSPERTNNPRAIARFQREARVGAQLQHEHLVRIYDEGEANGRCYLVMEFIEGKTIGQMINESGPFSGSAASRLVQQVALGLEHARQKDLIHRDVNPWNILVTPEGVAKLTDLGLAIDLGEDAAVTRDGATVGTFDYISPEQARHSHNVDTRSDIYSLGCTIYHMIAGQVPFPVASLPEKLYSHQVTEPEPLGKIVPDVPPGLERVVAKMLMKDPAKRFSTPKDVARALEPFIEALDTPDVGRKSATGTVTVESAALPPAGPALFIAPPPTAVETGGTNPLAFLNIDFNKPIDTPLPVADSRPIPAELRSSSGELQSSDTSRGVKESDSSKTPAVTETVGSKPASRSATNVESPKAEPVAPVRDPADFVWPTEIGLDTPAKTSGGVGVSPFLSLNIDSGPKHEAAVVGGSSSTSASKRAATDAGSPSASGSRGKDKPKAQTPAPAADQEPVEDEKVETPARQAAKSEFDPERAARMRQTLIYAGSAVAVLVLIVGLIVAMQSWRSIDKPVDLTSNLRKIQQEDDEPKGPPPKLAIRFSDGYEEVIWKFDEAFSRGGNRAFELVVGDPEPLVVTSKEAFLVPDAAMTIRPARGIKPKLIFKPQSSDPVFRVRPGGKLFLLGLTIEVEYPEKLDKPPSLVEASGDSTLRYCSIRTKRSLPGSTVVVAEGRMFEAKGCFIQGFDHAFDLKLYSESKARVEGCVLIGGGGGEPAESWIARARYEPSNRGKNKRELVMLNNTIMAPAALAIEGFSPEDPASIEFKNNAVRVKILAAWKSPAKFDRTSLIWTAADNVYDVAGPGWIAGSTDAPADADAWLRTQKDADSHAREISEFVAAAKKPAESLSPADFPAQSQGAVAIGAPPAEVGPDSYKK